MIDYWQLPLGARLAEHWTTHLQNLVQCAKLVKSFCGEQHAIHKAANHYIHGASQVIACFSNTAKLSSYLIHLHVDLPVPQGLLSFFSWGK